MHSIHFVFPAGLVLALSSIAALADPPKPASGDVDAGKAYAQATCAGCHAMDQAAKVSPNIKAPPFALIATTKLVTSREIDIWLQSAHPDMPDLLVPAAQRANVIAFIGSLASSK